jgi:hypothetical protein
MSEDNASDDNSTPEGPATLRDALTEAFREAAEKETDATAQPNDAEPELDTSDDDQAEEDSSDAQAQEDTDVITAPEHWSDEDQATFNELPRDAQSYLLKREKQYEKGIREKSEALKQYEEAMKPYESSLSMRGIDKTQAINSWVRAQSMLDANPVDGLKMLIDSYGQDVATKLLQKFDTTPMADNTDSDTQWTDPEVKKLKEQLQEVQNQNLQITNNAEAQRQQEAQKMVQEFSAAVDDDGKLIHPHFEKVQPMMQAMLYSGAASDLEDAYKQAIWTVPEYRDEFTEQQQKQAQAKAAKEREKAAVKAKKTAASVNGKASKPPPPDRPRTLREDLRAAWEQSIRGEI